jgi:hypothetical protein
MKYLLALSFVCVCTGVVHAQPPLTTTVFPLSVGSSWTYIVRGGKDSPKDEKKTVEVEIEREEPYLRKKKDGEGKEVERKYVGYIMKMTSGAKTLMDHVVVLEDGVYRIYASKTPIDPPTPISPPLCFIKLVDKTRTWDVDCKRGNISIKGTYSIEADSVKVPAGKYEKAFLVSYTNNKTGEERIEVQTWYVLDVGMVKQRINERGNEIVLELEKYKIAMKKLP